VLVSLCYPPQGGELLSERDILKNQLSLLEIVRNDAAKLGHQHSGPSTPISSSLVGRSPHDSWSPTDSGTGILRGCSLR